MAAFLANVGVNATHRVRSPLFADGTFQLFPIPERLPWREPMLRLPEVWGDRAVHLDPDLTGPQPTYGDNCRRAGRAYSLRSALPGDTIIFIARLETTRPLPGAGFFLVGELPIRDIAADLAGDPGPGWWDANAHVRRSRAGAPWDFFWVFRGGKSSRLYARAVHFGRFEADRVFGGCWHWRPNRSELQTIGSYTRAVRRLEGRAEDDLRSLCPS